MKMSRGPRQTSHRPRDTLPPTASDDFEQASSAHAATDAHGDHDVLHPATLAFDQRGAGHARAAHAVGMADRDRATVHVQALLRNAELVAAVQYLHGKRFVELP